MLPGGGLTRRHPAVTHNLVRSTRTTCDLLGQNSRRRQRLSADARGFGFRTPTSSSQSGGSPASLPTSDRARGQHCGSYRMITELGPDHPDTLTSGSSAHSLDPQGRAPGDLLVALLPDRERVLALTTPTPSAPGTTPQVGPARPGTRWRPAICSPPSARPRAGPGSRLSDMPLCHEGS
jgi:hypothetical protein